jgi:hypothetical protein
MMTAKTMGKRPVEFILETVGNLSFETVTIQSGAGKLEPGTVLGEVTANEKFDASPAAVTVGKEGAEVAKAILMHGVDATDEDQEVAVVDTLASVKIDLLVFDASVDDDAKKSTKFEQLRAVNIKVR